jgi:hypothetical protein
LYADLIGHWEKRNRDALAEVDPRNLDRAQLLALAQTYGDPEMIAALERQQHRSSATSREATAVGGVADLDDYAACNITQKKDLRDLFVDNFYFGCEADDPMNAWAFHRKGNPFGAKIHALFGSDIGHFDVPDMTEVLPEAYELVEDELISADDFRDFTFANAVRFWGSANPNFFKGTVVEKAAAAVLADEAKA